VHRSLTRDQRYGELILSDPDITPDEPLPLECLYAFNSLWEDKGIQMAMLKGNEYALHDNLS
jgi:guanine nucleotide-binding protein subunit alpha